MTSDRITRLLAALLLSWTAAACHTHVDGTYVELAAEVSPTPALIDADGATLSLERFDVELGVLELLPCEDPVARVLRELVLPGRARAHHPAHDSPTTLEVGTRLDLRAGDDQELGALTPPPGRYCGAMLALGAARLRGSVGERVVDRELEAGTHFFTFDAFELSAERLDVRLVVRFSLASLFADLALASATEGAIDEAVRQGLAERVEVLEVPVASPE